MDTTDRVKYTRDDYKTMIGLSTRRSPRKRGRSFLPAKSKSSMKLDGKRRARGVMQRGRGGRRGQRGGIRLRGGFAGRGFIDVVLAALINKVPRKMKDAIIDAMTARQVDNIGKLIKSYLDSEIKVSPKVLRQLRRDRRYLSALTKTGKKGVPVRVRKQIVSQKGGILGLALGALAPAVLPLLKNLF